MRLGPSKEVLAYNNISNALRLLDTAKYQVDRRYLERLLAAWDILNDVMYDINTEALDGGRPPVSS